jgi:predicted nucleotidyltransferase
MEARSPRPRAKEKSCDKAILRTLSYSSIFQYPMSLFQLYTFLITKNEFEFEFFKKSLRRLVKKRHIKAKDGKYYLPNTRPVSWSLRYKYSEDLMKETLEYIKPLRSIPWIKLVTVTGSLAKYNAKKDDDIDIFIITDKNRLWLTRGFVFIILKIINKYAQGPESKRKFCCNLFVDESKMLWNKEKHNLYIAHEILSMHPIMIRDETYLRFLKDNEWVFKYFKNLKFLFPVKYGHDSKSKSRFVDLLENIARKAQLRYMDKKKTFEITTKNLIHFNKNDHSAEILNEYDSLVHKYK